MMSVCKIRDFTRQIGVGSFLSPGRRLALAGLILAAGAASTLAQPSSFGGIGDLGGGVFESYALACSADGSVIVGVSSGDGGQRAFRWTGSSGMIDLGDPPGLRTTSNARSISPDGTVIGGGVNTPAGRVAFRWTLASGMTTIGDLPGGATNADVRGITADGLTLVGEADQDFGPPRIGRAFRWQLVSGMVPLADSYSRAEAITPDGRFTTGQVQTVRGLEMYRWSPATGFVLLGDLQGGAFESFGGNISADGNTIVGGGTSAEGFRAVRWTPASGIVELGNLKGAVAGSFSYAWSTSSDGAVVVGTGNNAPATGGEAFIWTQGDGLRRLYDALVGDYGLGGSLDGWKLQVASDISEDGKTIVGWGINPDGRPEAWVAVLGSRTGGARCPVDINGDGALDIRDFTEFQTRFAIGCP